MKKIDKKVYQESQLDKGHLVTVGLVVMLIALALLIGGVWLFVKGVQIKGVFATIWRLVLASGMVLLGLPIGYVAFMMLVTANSMIDAKQGSVSDIGNTGKGTANVYKCHKCGNKMDEPTDHCANCGAKLEGAVKCECGHKNKVDAKHCVKCGKELN